MEEPRRSIDVTPIRDADARHNYEVMLRFRDRLVSAGTLTGKIAAVIDTGNSQTVASFSSALAARGFALITAEGSDARAHGRAVGAAIMRSVGQPTR